MQELKSAVQNSEQIAQQEVTPQGEQQTSAQQEIAQRDTSPENALSPADMAELAEQDESQLELTSAYYPEDDTLADVAPSTKSQSEKA